MSKFHQELAVLTWQLKPVVINICFQLGFFNMGE